MSDSTLETDPGTFGYRDTEGGEDGDIFEVLNDADCRRLLAAIGDDPTTARDLVESCDIPQSTVYRKLNRLVRTSLVEPSLRIRPSGRNVREYRRRVGRIVVMVGSGDGIDVQLDD